MERTSTQVAVAATVIIGACLVWVVGFRDQTEEGVVVPADFASAFGQPFIECPVNSATVIGKVGIGQCRKWTYSVTAADHRSNIRAISLDFDLWVDSHGTCNGLSVHPILSSSSPSSVFEIYVAVARDDRDPEPGMPRNLALRLAVACRGCRTSCQDQVAVGLCDAFPSLSPIRGTRGVSEFYDDLYIIDTAKWTSEEWTSSFGIRDAHFRFSRRAAASLPPCK